MAGDQPVLDIGCADGDVCFFSESLGHRVQAIDNPVTNFNAMRAVRALKIALNSGSEIHNMDIDRQLVLPESQYGLVLLLGVLYHLKNPYHLLETLSRHARYCVVSTSITAFVPGSYENVTGSSLAYFTDVYELNSDSTNYWIFSDAGFRRLLKRSNWEICDYLLISEGSGSLPRIADQRAFCLVKSKFSDGRVRILYGKGWHVAEGPGWRWTEKEFSIRLESSWDVSASHLILNVFVPEELIARFNGVTLHAAANGVDLSPEFFRRSGEQVYRRSLLAACTGDGDVRVDFWLDNALPPDALDSRERGIIVSSLTVG